MNPYDELDTLAREAQTLDDSARVLANLLSGGYAVCEDGDLYNIRQLVARCGALQIHVYANEHAPPHFHVKGADVDGAFTIADCAFMYGSIDSREQRLVQWWYKRSRPLIIAAWNATRPSNCQVGPVVE